MTKEQEEAIKTMKHWIDFEKQNKDKINKADELIKIQETVLNMLKEKDKEIELIKEYAHQEIEHYTETIEDYIDDDKVRNKDYIKELKEEREHWKDIERILENKLEELYMNWWKYGLYE